MNNNFSYPSPITPDEMQRQMAGPTQRRSQKNQARGSGGDNDMAINTGNQGNNSLGNANGQNITMSGGDSLDDIIRQNSHELQRRRSVPQPFTSPMMQGEPDRRLSMMDYGGPGDRFHDFHYGSAGATNNAMAGSYGGMGAGMAHPGHSGPYQPGLMAMSDHADFPISPDMMGSMMGFSNLNVGAMTADPSSLSLYTSPSLGSQYQPGSLDTANNDFAMDMNVDSGTLSATSNNPSVGLGHKTEDELMAVEQTFGASGDSTGSSRQIGSAMDHGLGPYGPHVPPRLSQDMPGSTSYQSPASGTMSTVTAPTPTAMTPATSAPTPMGGDAASKEKTVYSKSGFDMLRALWYVATRKNAQIQLGAVDMSCAFVVCDVTQNDCPIIYVSDNFQNLTGYSRHEIVGKNCRFLQAPDGAVEAGSNREFVENDAVYRLKRTIADGEEIQQSLINYRKGGKPFLNLLTMVPIPWDTDEIRYFIGFQIDLVECPDAISGNQGAIQTNYKHSDIGQYIWTPPTSGQWEPESGQTLGIDDVSTLLQQFSPKGVSSDWHKQSWDKMLLENADDVVHVLSLKGLFLYLSPACKKVLEYDGHELVGQSLSSICHPSDIVPVTRELKDAQQHAPVNIVFRVRRKHSGFTWFESHGTLFSDQGKGRKCIILVGRKRPVFTLRRSDLEANGGIGDSEIWAKVSTSGMFLFVSSNVRSLLDLLPENLEGTSMQDLMRKESRPEFGRTIEKARRGRIVSCKHEIQNKRGQVLQAHTTFYPGDAAEGEKPTFLLAQTKLVKASSRATAPATTILKPGLALSNDIPSTVDLSIGTVVAVNNVVTKFDKDAVLSIAQDIASATDDNIFDELKTTRATSWQYELRQMEKVNRMLAEELAQLLSNKKKRKRRKGGGNMVRDCANCHTRNTPEWRRGPSGNRDLCNSCGLRWAKQTGRVSPRNSSRGGGGTGDSVSKKSNSPIHSSPLQREVPAIKELPSLDPPTNRSTTSGTSATLTPDENSPTAGAHAPTSPTAAGGKAAAGAHHPFPPQSRPLLEGGSGLGGGGMEMALIQEEEREPSA
ncbi:PAS domain-containing protein [Bombardia bombarda]|uniref:PAS domain-containing protein n=1 Tax=Bombardia bombarda TaxID=252184 RepID=A0AA39T121_9PEZI|nr:PAS domain-containing protein [Bombardia bombarda]